MIADRYVATEQLLALLHLVGAVILYCLSTIRLPTLFYFAALAYFFSFTPTLSLTNSISLHHLANPANEFSKIRVWGTIGWIAAGLLVGGLAVEATSTPMVIAAAAQALLALISLALPHTPPSRAHAGQSIANSLGLGALEMLKDWSFAVFMLGSFLISVPLQFYYTFTNPFLHELGVANAAGKQTCAQFSEIVCMMLLPLFFVRLGVKWMLLIGMAAWALRYLLFAFGDAGGRMWMLYAGISLHGACYVLFFVTGQIYVDNKASRKTRAAAQGFLAVVTLGLGQFVGSIVSGREVHYFASPAGVVGHDWRDIWLVPSAMAGAALVFFAIAFHDDKHPPFEEPLLSSADEPLLQLPHGTLD
jgi:nucleoside transporter